VPAPAGPLTAPGFVGRGAELDALADLLETARTGHGGAFLVTGDAGVGKTRLVHQACGSVGPDVLVLTGSCLPLSSLTVPLLPLRTAVRTLPAADRPVLEVGSGGTAQAAEDFDAWLEATCEERAVTVVVDDLQWADSTTLDVLMWVLSSLTTRRLAVLLTLRRGEVGTGHPLHHWLADVRRLPGFGELNLGPLDLEETREQIAAVLGDVPHDGLVREVFGRSGGNAYLNRLLVAGVPSNATRLGDAALSDDLNTAVLRRWHDLSPAARELARVIAVGARVARGRDLEYAAELAGVGDPVPLLRECLDAELLDPQPEDGYWFHHPLQAEALEASLAPGERRRLHSAYAALLEADLDGSGPDLATAILIADHHHRAGAIGQADTWSLRAADIAEARGDDSEAIRLLQRVIDLRGRLADDGTADPTLLQRQRMAAARAGDFEAELAATESILRDPGTDSLTAAELIVRRQHLRFSTGRGFLDTDEMRRAVDLAETVPESWQLAYALAEAAHAALWSDDADAPALATRALEVARVTEHPRALAYALAANVMAALFAGRNEEAPALAHEAVAAAARARDGWGFGHAVLWEANATDVPITERHTATLARRRRELEMLGLAHPFVAWLAAVEADTRLHRGQWEACVGLLREALGSTPGALVDVNSRLTAARLAARQGRPDEARGHLARVDELFVETSSFLPFEFDASRAITHLAAGDARGCIAAALAGAAHPGVPVTMCEWLMPLAARALADLAQQERDHGGDPAPVVAELDDLATRFPHTIADLMGDNPTYAHQIAALDALYQAELARGRQAPDVVGPWTAAATLLADVGLLWDECYASWRLAEALFQVGPSRRADAVAALRRAHALAVQLDARPDLGQVLALARTARVPLDDPRPTEPAAAREDGVRLTAREEEVLAHIVAGRTYGEIARALVLSEKTVSSHVSHLLAKTATSNRVDLARWAARRATAGSGTRPA
jgi:DNA-binding CsgD family transcriptional regulator